MIAKLVLCLGLVGVVLATACTIEDRKEMQLEWSNIWSAQFTGRRLSIAQAVFDDIFKHNPDSMKLFVRVNVNDQSSPAFKAHCIRVINGLDSTIGLLSDPATLDVQLAHLAFQHEERTGVTKAHFDAMADAFLRVMPQVASCFNRDSWSRCFKRISDGITVRLD